MNAKSFWRAGAALCVAGVVTASGAAGIVSLRPGLWFTGPSDGVDQITSQSVGPFDASAADDFVLGNPAANGADFVITSLRGWMSTSGIAGVPTFEVTVFADDGAGHPGAAINTFSGTEVSSTLETGFTLREVLASNLELHLAPSARYWIRWRGLGGGTYAFVTGGNGTVKGLECQFRSPTEGITNFTPASQVPGLVNAPTDLAFQVRGFQLKTVGDANGDGTVNFADLTTTINRFGAVYPGETGAGDANNDGRVDFGDFSAVLGNWGR